MYRYQFKSACHWTITKCNVKMSLGCLVVLIPAGSTSRQTIIGSEEEIGIISKTISTKTGLSEWQWLIMKGEKKQRWLNVQKCWWTTCKISSHVSEKAIQQKVLTRGRVPVNFCWPNTILVSCKETLNCNGYMCIVSSASLLYVLPKSYIVYIQMNTTNALQHAQAI